MDDRRGEGLNPRSDGKRPGSPTFSGTDPKRPRTAPQLDTPEGTHAPGIATENPLDQSSLPTHSDRNLEVNRPKLSLHQRDGEDATATLEESVSAAEQTRTAGSRRTRIPQHMLPQTVDFFISSQFLEAIAIVNEARLGMMIERIQRGQVEGFVFDRQDLAWTWEGIQDDFVRAANDGWIAALNQNAQTITNDPYDSDDWGNEISDFDVVPKHIINAMEEAVAQCSVLAADWDDVLAALKGSPTYAELRDALELVGTNLTTTLEICSERTAKGNWGDDAQRLTAMKEFPLHVVRAGGAMTYDQEGKVDVLRDWSSFRDQLHADLVPVWSAINEAQSILADLNIDNFRLMSMTMSSFYASPACRDQVNLRDRLVDFVWPHSN
ncbi:hypothetical protein CEP54_009267 [Fusarium duplospermum]|uniref:Uncharacterized protein n=1 Tax=Fusarium duplospermum TaxID=1325734 RepID=A0A428PRP1_9HYPO|nr:hypothetical protein CEP54_009267 [Fusarium duplospermum]